jgi:2'-5' RNA ligase
MKQRKLFIGINLPEISKKRLAERMEKWQDLPVKWTRSENLHITLLFLGYVDNDVVPEICQKVEDASNLFDVFDIHFEKIVLAPKKDDPKMFWLEGEKSEEMRELFDTLKKELGIFLAESKEFRPHVTLGKIRKEKWAVLPEKPEIDEKMDFSMLVENIEVLENIEEHGKRTYIPIQSCPLN